MSSDTQSFTVFFIITFLIFVNAWLLLQLTFWLKCLMFDIARSFSNSGYWPLFGECQSVRISVFIMQLGRVTFANWKLSCIWWHCFVSFSDLFFKEVKLLFWKSLLDVQGTLSITKVPSAMFSLYFQPFWDGFCHTNHLSCQSAGKGAPEDGKHLACSENCVLELAPPQGGQWQHCGTCFPLHWVLPGLPG